MNGWLENLLTKNNMSHTLNKINTRIRDIENKLIRINSWEYNLQCPVQVKTALWMTLARLEMQKYDIMYS